MKRLFIQFLIVMTAISLFYAYFLKSRRARIARTIEISNSYNQSAPGELPVTPQVDPMDIPWNPDAPLSTDPRFTKDGIVETAKENADAFQTSMDDRFKQAKSVFDFSKEPPPPTLLSEEMKKRKKEMMRRSGGDGLIDLLLDNVRDSAESYEKSAAKHHKQAHATAQAAKELAKEDEAK